MGNLKKRLKIYSCKGTRLLKNKQFKNIKCMFQF